MPIRAERTLSLVVSRAPAPIEVRVSSRLLAPLLVLCGLIALTPSVLWASARLFDRVDDRWLDALGATGVTLPIALALAALTLVVHGLWTNAAIEEELAEEAAIQRDLIAQLSLRATTSVPAGAGATVATAASPTGPRTATVSASRRTADGTAEVAAVPAAGEADPAAAKAPSKGRKMADKAVKRGGRRAAGKGKMAARRQMRETMRGMRG